MKDFLAKYKVSSLIISMVSLVGGSGYIGMLIIQDMPIYKHIDKAYETSLKVDSIQKINIIRLNYAFEYIKEQNEKKEQEYQVGLRFKKANGQLYFRDKNKEYRIIKHDKTGDYYRDENDKRVYINDKLYY